MSFSCEIKGKGGIDLLEKYGIQYQLLGIARNGIGESEEGHEHYDLSEIRSTFCDYFRMCGESITKEQSRCLVGEVQKMIYYNLQSLRPSHCESCKCPEIIPKSWDIESANKFLSIPLNEVYKAYGGY